jgi:hypothetical protein
MVATIFIRPSLRRAGRKDKAKRRVRSYERHLVGSRSFVFPEMQGGELGAGPVWHHRCRLGFVDYLFIVSTTGSTFGPTDAPILQPWAKSLAMLQAIISLTIMVLLISRAVGVL